MVIGLLAYQELLVFSLALSGLMVVISRFLTDQKRMKKAREDIKFYRDKLNKSIKSGSKGESDKFMKEMNKASMEQFRYSSRSLIFSMLIFFIAIGWFGATFAELIVKLPFPLPFMSWDFPFLHITREYEWLWWYIIILLPTSITLRKFFDVV